MRWTVLAWGCAPLDAEALLLDVATAHGELAPALDASTGTDVSEPGATWSGTMDLGDATVEGSLVVDGDVDAEVVWHWDLAVSWDSVRVRAGAASAAGNWLVDVRRYDYEIQEHAWDGEVVVDGDPLAVSFESVFQGNLHRVDGEVDGEPVSWVNPDPDLP